MVNHPRLRHWLSRQTRQFLQNRRVVFDATQASLKTLRSDTDALQRRVDSLSQRVAQLSAELQWLDEPFAATMTIDQAWRRHPGAAMVFARHHLPSCQGCAVRFEETLAEAAAAYGLDLGHLLDELNALL